MIESFNVCWYQVGQSKWRRKIKDQTDINLSTKLRSLGVVIDDNLTLKYQFAAIKKSIRGPINVAKISRRLSTESLS